MDPTVSGVTWSRAFTQNPPLKDLCTHPTLSCPPPLPPSLKIEATQDLKVKSTQKPTVPEAWGVFNWHFCYCPLTIKRGEKEPISQYTKLLLNETCEKNRALGCNQVRPAWGNPLVRRVWGQGWGAVKCLLHHNGGGGLWCKSPSTEAASPHRGR